MGWWPFTRKGPDLSNDPQIRGTRTWLLDLQALCETHYEDRVGGIEAIKSLQEDWHAAHQRNLVPKSICFTDVFEPEKLIVDQNAYIIDFPLWGRKSGNS